jgi:chromosome segregation ATPase
MITLAVLVLGLVGCGADPQKTTISESAPNQKLIVDLQDTIAQSRDNLEKEKERNAELMKRVQSLLEGLTEAEKRFSSLQKGEAGDISPEAERKRIELMGAKALAEFRAEQFRQRLDELAKDLDKKEKELETIRQNALDKDAEVQELRKAIDEIQRAERTRTQELSARLEQITRDLEERTAVASQFKKDLDEKNELLVTLKNAVADASKLKANAEAEIARLQNELSEVSKQLQASQSLAAQQDQDLTVAVNRTGQCQQEVQRLVVEVQTWQEETQRAQQETEKIKVIAQEWAEDAKQFKTDMERSRQEAEQFKAESNRSRDEIVAFRVETDRARQEAQDLRTRVWELSLKLQSVEAKLQSQEADKQSSVDKLLEHPVVTQERDPVSNLY